jgi:carbon starvation protein
LALAFVCYWAGNRFYGTRIEQLFQIDPQRRTPAHELRDGVDYIPAKRHVLFAHHFAAIAGAGPIVGPTLACAYGIVPALVWVVAGAIFLGGVHDMSVLIISVREQGRSIADIARKVLGPTGYSLMLGFLLICLFMITATFLNLSVVALTSAYPAGKVGLQTPTEAELRAYADRFPAQAMVSYRAHPWMPTSIAVKATTPARQSAAPEGELLTETPVKSYTLMARIGGIASTSVLLITVCAPFLGWLIYRRNLSARFSYPLAALVCLASVVLGLKFPVNVTVELWRVFMTIYVVLASAVPVWLLLMPRDFVNVQILYLGVAGIFAGLLTWGAGVSAGTGATAAVRDMPWFSHQDGMQYVGMLWPMMLITVSCGAISGFHCLVSSGTSAKQLANEGDARRIAYQAMLLESMLAVAVILTLYVGLTRGDYLQITYLDKNPVLAISLATGNLLHSAFHIPIWCGTVFGILLLEGFVVTTLDVAVRLTRYLLEELWKITWKRPHPLLLNIWFNTGLAVAGMYALSRWNALPVLWRVFGSANQMMAAMALLVVAAWMRQHGRRYAFALVPCVIMFVTTLTSTVISLRLNVLNKNWSLTVACIVLLGLALGMIVVGIRGFRNPPLPILSPKLASDRI